MFEERKQPAASTTATVTSTNAADKTKGQQDSSSMSSSMSESVLAPGKEEAQGQGLEGQGGDIKATSLDETMRRKRQKTT